MTTTLDYELKDALPFLTKDNRWNVLTVLILHANVRNRCWPSMDTITELATNGNRTKATRAKKWLERHGVFESVEYSKRVAEELKLSPRQTIYQLLGTIKACNEVGCDCKNDGKIYHYLYIGKQNISVQTVDNLNGETINSLNGETFHRLNGETGSISNEVSPIEVLPRKSAKRNPEPFYDAIALVFKVKASGQIIAIRSMMQGKATRGTWRDCNFDPPVTDAKEIIAFGDYMLRRMREKNVTEPITAAVTIQRWFYDFRAEEARKAAAASNIIEFDLDKWVVPELETA